VFSRLAPAFRYPLAPSLPRAPPQSAAAAAAGSAPKAPPRSAAAASAAFAAASPPARPSSAAAAAAAAAVAAAGTAAAARAAAARARAPAAAAAPPSAVVGGAAALLYDTDDADVEWGEASTKFSIVFVTSEVAPWSKTGGLGDVAGALPPALAKRGHRVMVIAPRYLNGTANDRLYDGALDANCRIKVSCFSGTHDAAFFHQYSDGVDWVFVDHPCYHRPGTPYGDQGGAFGDNMFRFTLLCHAACEAPLVLPCGGFPYGDNVVFVANDWHAGLVPPLIASRYRPFGVYRDARCVYEIHNLLHQGVEPITAFPALGLPADWMGALKWVYPEHMRAHPLDKGETVNLLKGAVCTADRVMTVSQNYAYEVTTPEGGCGLETVLQSRKAKLDGVVNGIDLDEWNPRSDEYLPAHYTVNDFAGKVLCKAALQKELGLPVRADVPLIGFIGRLDWQKGPELIRDAIGAIMGQDVQLVMLGSGRWDLQEFLKSTESVHRDKFRGWVGFSVAVSHRITAGADILLMPSKFEPCGLNQLYAMRYGTVPVVHSTGGLADTVTAYSDTSAPTTPAIGTGFLFSPANGDAMMGALNAAIRLYREKPERWRALMQSGMRRDSSWGQVATRYEQIFAWAKMDPPYCS
jgi:starch synthase